MESTGKKQTLWLGLAIVWVAAIALYYGMVALEPVLLANPHLFDYLTWWQNSISDDSGTNILYKFLWAIGDFSEGVVCRSVLCSVGLILFALLAHYINKHHPNVKVYGISQASGNLPWVLVAAITGLLVSTFVYGWHFLPEGWIPTFLPGCTIPAALVLMYGGGWAIALTGGVLSGLIQFPLAYIGANLATSAGFPSLVLVSIFGMSVGGILITLIFNILPWTRPYVLGKKAKSIPGYGEKLQPIPVEATAGWVIRRTFTDPTEVFFMGSEIAGIGVMLGALVSWLLNPAHILYGVPNLFPAVFCAELMGCSLAAVVWYKKWKALAWYTTYTVPITIGVVLLQFGTSLPLMLITVVLSVLIVPPIAWALMLQSLKRLPKFPGMIGSVAGMGIGIAIVTLIIRGIMYIGIL